jgi:hypothetical protein
MARMAPNIKTGLWGEKSKYHGTMSDPPIDHATKLGLLKDEYLLLQRLYEDFDGRVITIKGWSATIGLAALGTGFIYSRYLWLYAAGVGLVFWTLEAIWKSFQYNYASRILVLEQAFRKGQIESIEPLQIYTAWDKEFQDSGYAVLGNMRLPLVFFPHIVSILAGPALFLLNMHFHFQTH